MKRKPREKWAVPHRLLDEVLGLMEREQIEEGTATATFVQGDKVRVTVRVIPAKSLKVRAGAHITGEK